MLKIDRNGDLWVPTKVLKTFKSGEVKDLVFKDETTKKNKSIAIYVEVEKVGNLIGYKPKCADKPSTKIIQYTTI